MPEAGDGWFGKLGNPRHPCVSTHTGPSCLGVPDKVLGLSQGFTCTPLVDAEGRVYFTQGLCPKANVIFVVEPDGSMRHIGTPMVSGAPALLEGSLIVADERGYCGSVDPKTGQVNWSAKFCGTCGSDSWSVGASKSMLVMQGSIPEPSDLSILPPCDHVFGLSPKDGKEKWKFKANTFLNNFLPCIADDVVVFTDLFGGLYCLKLADGAVKWQVKGDGSMIARSSGGASVFDGVVYQSLNLKAKRAPNATCGGRGAVRAYDLKTGALKWEVLYESEMLEAHAVPVVTPKGPGGKPAVVVGVGPLAGMPPPQPPAGDEWRGKVVALDPKSGKELWAFTPEPHRGVCCSGASEKMPWKACPWSSAACGADGLLYVGWHGGFLFVLDGATGEKRSEWKVGASVQGTPALGPGGVLAVAGLQGAFIWHAESISNWGGSGWQVHEELKRTYSETGTEHFATCRVANAERPYQNPYEAPTDLSKPTWCSWFRERADGDVNNGGVFVDSQRNIWTGWNSGHLRCIRPDGTQRASATFGMSLAVFNAVLHGMNILYVDFLGHVVSWNMETLEQNWAKRYFISIGTSGLGPTVYEDLFLGCGKQEACADGEDSMVCVDCRDGSLKWCNRFSADKGGSYNTFPQVATLPNEGGRKVVIAGTLPGGFYAIYLDDGSLYWEVHLPLAFTTASPTLGPGDGMMYVAHNHPGDTAGQIYAVDLKDKSFKWSYDCSRPWAPRHPVTQVPVIVPSELTEKKAGDIVVLGLGTVVCGTEPEREILFRANGELHGELVGLDAETGQERWSFKPPPLRSVYPAGCSVGDTSPPDSWGGAQVSCRGIIYTYWQAGYVFAINGSTGAEISRYYTGSFANGSPALAPGMLVVAAFDRVICWRDEALEDKWLAENSSDPRAGSWKPLKAPEAEEETGPAPPRNILLLDLGLPFPTIGGEMEAAKAPTAPAAKKPAAAKKQADDSAQGTVWVVVGGGSAGGIVVRKGEGLKTAELPRLATGARVEEVERVGDRLHFKKLSGDGPDFGWVSLTFKGSPLVQKE
mmetsp:Transcript_32595/g.77473  ORF Transcript_32595/g.77473 Transcript_32595/m.77473 type:complete len:1039 (-) Transcript_32595:222-3338(-)